MPNRVLKWFWWPRKLWLWSRVFLDKSGCGEYELFRKNPFQIWNIIILCGLFIKRSVRIIFFTIRSSRIFTDAGAAMCGMHSSAMIAGLGGIFNKSGIGNRIKMSLKIGLLAIFGFVLVLTIILSFCRKSGLFLPEKLVLLKRRRGWFELFPSGRPMPVPGKTSFLMIARFMTKGMRICKYCWSDP